MNKIIKWKSFSKIDILFLGLVTLAFSLRSVYLKQTIRFLEPGLGSDGHFYLSWARDIVLGNTINREILFALPMYPYFLSAVYIFSKGELFSILLIQILIGSINCGLLYILGKKLFNQQVGVIASLIGCTYGLFVFYDRMFLPATLAIFLAMILILAMVQARDNPSVENWSIAGFYLGLCILTKAAFSMVFFIMIAWMIYEYRRNTFKKVCVYCLCFIIPSFLLLAGLGARNYLVTGNLAWAPAHTGINFYIGNNPQANGLFKVPEHMRSTQKGLIEDARILAEKMQGKRLEPQEASGFWLSRSWDFIKTQPLQYLRLLGKKIVLFWNSKEHVDDVEYYIFREKAGLPVLGLSFMLPIALSGMFSLWGQRKRIAFLYLFIFSLMLSTTLFFINSRYRLLAIPFLTVFAAAFIWNTFERIKSKKYKSLSISLLLLLVLYVLTHIDITAEHTQLNFTFHYNKGVIYADQGQYLQSEQEFQKALMINPYDFMSYLGLGNVYYKMKDFPAAINSYKRALSINPYFYEANFNLGIIYSEMGLKKQAEQEFRKVVELKSDDCAGHYNLGIIYQEQGEIERALEEYNLALEAEPNRREIISAIEKLKQESSEEKGDPND
ncbi:MAG: tetratricopeptide repeat protein [Candidatus Omnitrophica bacterium]|nr:tetratricopeptide repeat protein [Candidatus Omnitrophota bacterium]